MSSSIWRLIISQAVANLADVFLRVIVIANVFNLSNSVVATSMIPILIGLSAFGASFLVPLVTRHIPLNKLLFLTQCGKTILLTILILVLWLKTAIALPIIYTFIILISLLDGFASPVSHAIVPRYATDLGKANAALSMSNEGIQLVGWGMGGLLFSNVGLFPSMSTTLVLFLISTVLMFTLPLVTNQSVESETSFAILTKGLRLVATNPILKFLIQINCLETLANSIWVSSIMLIFVTEVIHQSENYWGYANTAYSIGILLGGFFVYRLSKLLLKYKWQGILFSLFWMILVTILIIQFPKASIFLILTTAIGFLSQLKEVAESVLLQESVPENDLVNAYSAFEVISTISFSGFVFIMSSITDRFGVISSFWITIICLILELVIVIINRHLMD